MLITTGLALVVAALVAGSARIAEAAPAAARIERIRYVADAGSTRVIVVLSRSVPHEVVVLPGDPARGSERRLVLDFSNARLGPAAVRPIGVEDGILKRIRTGQFTARTARVVLDLASVTAHKVRVQDDPPRVVIDIVGSPAPDGPAPEVAADRAPSGGAAGRPGPSTEPGGGAGTHAATVKRTGGNRAPETGAKQAARPSGEQRAASLASANSADKKEDGSRRGTGGGAAAQRPRWRIVIDPGHGGSDPGARGVGGVLEKDVVLAVAKRLANLLREKLHAEVLLTRSDDTTRSLAERTAFANANDADLFVSIHSNADQTGRLHGVETYTLNNSADQATIRLAKMENGPAFEADGGDLSLILSDLVQSGKEEESADLAERLQGAVLRQLRSRYPEVRDLGVKKGPFYVLVGAYMPCVLVEVSFLSHPVEGRRLATAAYQAAIAEGLYRGVAEFLDGARLAKTL